MFEITPAFGGRIVRDRLWFFGSARLNRALLAPAGALYADGRPVSVTCDTNDPNQLRFCDQTGKLHHELGLVPALPFPHEFKLALAYPLPWDFKGALSVMSFPGVGGFVVGTASDPTPYLTVDWVVPADLFPGGRTQSVTVALNPPGSRYLQRFNQLDMSIKRTIRAGRMQVEPGVAAFNLLNSSLVLREIQTFGPALGQPLNTLQGRFLKLELLFKF